MGLPLALLLGLVFFFAASRTIENESKERFAAYAEVARNALAARIKSYVDLGTSTAALFGSRHPVSPLEFNSFVASIGMAANYPAVLGVNFLEHVAGKDRAAFLRRMRATRMPDGTLMDNFDIYPKGIREQYAVSTMSEPVLNIAHMYGGDLYPSRAAGIDYSRDTGKPASSGLPVKALSRPNDAVLSMRIPTYRPRAPIDTVEQRRAASTGSVGVLFSVSRLLAGVLGDMPVNNVRMTLVDRGLIGGQAPSPVLFDSRFGAAVATDWFGQPVERFGTTLPVAFLDRSWEASFSVDRDDMLSWFERLLPWLAMLTGFAGAMLIHALLRALTRSRRRAIKLARAMTRELRDSQARLQASHQRLRELAAHADDIKEEERKRIAREIHDDLGQNLLALRIEADILSNRTHQRHPRLHERARATLEQIDTTIRSVRHIINDLRPTVLDLGLSAAVEWQVAEFKRRTGIACDLIDLPEEPLLDEQSSTALFRILQESLSNIVRHARASHVRIELRTRETTLSMTVADNGVGLRAPERRRAGSFGLVGIEERMRILGGTFAIHSRPGMGTTVTVAVPLPAAQRHAPRTEQVPS